MLKNGSTFARGAGRGVLPSAACDVASATFEQAADVPRDRTEGERGDPTPRSPSTNVWDPVLPLVEQVSHAELELVAVAEDGGTCFA